MRRGILSNRSKAPVEKGLPMTPWLTLVIGVILGLLIGWLIELLFRRRIGAEVHAGETAASTRMADLSMPLTAPSTVTSAGSGATGAMDAAFHAAPGMEVALAEDVAATVKPEAPELALAVPAVEPFVETEPGLPPVAAEVPAPVENRLAEIVLPAAPVAAEDLGEALVDWPELSRGVEQVAGELEKPPTHIESVLPDVPERLSPADLAALAPAPGEVTRASARDDLLRIEGIGRVYDGRLRAAGINSFADVVSAGEARLQEVIQPQAWQRVNFADWIEQARLIVEGKEDELRVLQEQLFRRKKG